MKAPTHTRRFFVPDLSGEEVSPQPGEIHHALHVLRLRDGDEIELFDGRGNVAAGVMAILDRRNAVMRVTHRYPAMQPAGPAISLAFAAPKGKRTDWLIEKATELGAARLQRVIFERSTPAAKSESSGKTDKLMGHCISAAKQCGLNFLPELPPPVTLTELLEGQTDELCILGDTGPEAVSITQALGQRPDCDRITLLVGPEGGLTETERKDSMSHGFTPARVARTTLRTETAAVAMLAAVSASLPTS